jgi:hypothetical protein
MARVWLRTSDGVRCLPPVPIDSILHREDASFEIHNVMASNYKRLEAEPDL